MTDNPENEPGQADPEQALLRLAESLARRKPAPAPANLDAMDLVHNLKVHQIELEMQNEELRSAQEQLQAAQARYFDLYDRAPVGYLTLDLNGRVQTANFTAARMFGAEKRSFIGEPVTRFILPEDQDVFYLHRKRLEKGASRDCELRMLKAGGGAFWARLASAMGPAPEGAPVWRLTVSDIDEMKKSRELMDSQQETAKARRLSDIGTLAVTVAHELRNPLAAIAMAASNIRRKAGDPGLDRHFRNIDKKIAESNQIINNLLFYSRLRKPHYETVDLNPLIEECVGTALYMAKRGDSLLIDRDLPAGLSVEADPLQIKELLSNLLSNAVDAVAASPRGTIRIRTLQKGDSVGISVEDNGPGINASILDKVFEPFFSTKAKGTGLGLYVCRQIAALHGGNLTVKTGAGGTAVRMNLPRTRSKAGGKTPP